MWQKIVFNELFGGEICVRLIPFGDHELGKFLASTSCDLSQTTDKAQDMLSGNRKWSQARTCVFS